MKLKYILYYLYFSVVVYLVFLAGGNDTRQTIHLFAFDKGVNIIPIFNKLKLFSQRMQWYDNDWFYFFRELIGNFLLFFPVPFFLIWIEKYNKYKKVLLFCFWLTFSIECLQFLLNIGQADIDDVILNMAGASLATLIAFSLQRITARRAQYG